MKKIGILSVQGGFREHFDMLNSVDNIDPVLVKTKEDLTNIHGIILPGGESTTMGKLLKDSDLFHPLQESIVNGMPVWGTCAGMVLLAKKIVNEDYIHLGLMDIVVKRNGYGSQNNSFKAYHIIKEVSNIPIPLIFIRAPYIERTENSVEILSILHRKIIACKQKNILVTSFHPELTTTNIFHKYFIRTFF